LDMDIPEMGMKILLSIIIGIALVLVMSALYPLIPKDGPIGVGSLLEETVTFAIATLVVGGGTVAIWLLSGGDGF
jgi:hypothetical protein